jgi:hypothetical protein
MAAQMVNYPRGKLQDDDEGELTFAMYWKDKAHNTFIIDFGKDVKWIGLSREEAQQLALRILRMTVDKYVSLEIPDDPAV